MSHKVIKVAPSDHIFYQCSTLIIGQSSTVSIVSGMTYNVLMGTLNPTHTHSLYSFRYVPVENCNFSHPTNIQCPGSCSQNSFLFPFNGHFQVDLGQPVFIEAKDDGGGGDNWSCKLCKAPVKSSPPTNQHPVSFYRPDALPVTQPSLSDPQAQLPSRSQARPTWFTPFFPGKPIEGRAIEVARHLGSIYFCLLRTYMYTLMQFIQSWLPCIRTSTA